MEFLKSEDPSTASTPVPTSKLRWQVGSDTDIGGGRENQDDYFIWERPEEGVCVLGVLDGHGRDVGKLAAQTGKTFLKEYFEQNYSKISSDPMKCLGEALQLCHIEIKNAFRAELTKNGFEVSESPEGYLMKRRLASQQSWLCVHGGTSCTVAALIGRVIYTANVGDSTAILCSSSSVLKPTHLVYVGDAANLGTSHGTLPSSVASDEETDMIVITAEHSPESFSEYDRLLKFRSSEIDPRYPALHVVYDAPGQEKIKCPPCFDIDDNGNPTLTNRGAYYKNVRKEWASLVATPSSARYQDALAFTRSLGDLHLQTYGVSHLPEVHKIDLEEIFKSSAKNSEPLLLCLVMASDGVWDNWLYEDVTKFVMDSSCLEAVRGSVDGAHRVGKSFMARNTLFSKRNFGNQADNATGIVLYLSEIGSDQA